MANFNVPPYYDDYDENKNYYKVIFRPTTAVQARELNQMQTMLQKQIERFGSHIFREGSIVVGGAFDLQLDIKYTKASSISISPANLQNFVGKTVVGQISGIQAFIKAATYDAINNVYVFLFRYLNSSIDTDVFLSGEQVQVSTDATTFFTVDAVSPNGVGSIFEIEQGVIFSKGYFLAFPNQTVILDKYSAVPTITIGLNTVESFVTDLEDETLLDNALGYPNENAPGAHRYKVDVTLTTLSYKTGYDDPNFIPIMDLKQGVIETTEERTQYARIYDELAKRTYDESGDYFVRGFNIRTREHLDNGTNEGLFNSNNGGNSALLSVDIEPGIAYVKGYEVNKLVTEHVVTDKSLDFKTVNNQLVNARTGGYILIKEIVGTPDLDQGQVIDLYNTAETRITSNIKNDVSPSGTKIGTARVKSVVYENGTLGRPSGSMRLYIYDAQMNPGFVLSNTRAVHGNTAGSKFFADIDGASTVIYDSNLNNLLFPLGSEYTRTIRANTGSTDTSFQFNRTDDLQVNFASGGGVVSTSVSTVNESLSYGAGNLSVSEKRELIVSMNQDVDVRLPGTISGTSGTNTVTGSTTTFVNLSAGDRIKVGGNEYYIHSVTNSTSMRFTTNLATSPVANIFYKAIKSGDIIDLTANGSSGVVRTANVASNILNIDFKEDTSVTSSGTYDTKVTYRVERQTAREITKKLRANRFVKINTANNAAGVSGPFNLGISDVYKIRSIRLSNTAITSENDGVDATSSFVLIPGQSDNYYDHAKIRHIGGENLSTSNNILVKFDHFEPDYSTGFGYFSVDSYPVDDTQTSDTTIYTYEIPKYISSSGTVYNLRDALDFRPSKANTAASSVTVGSANVNPVTTDVFRTNDDGLRVVAPDSDITLDYSHYLARRDIVVMDVKGDINIIKGDASESPITPVVPDNVMGLAAIYIPPYPSISETLARKIGQRDIGCISRKIANVRYTMRDIGVIKNRVDNLEYYNALSLLEKSAVDLKIIDENGLDRFKNGFFVDSFADHSLGDTTNIDYKISIDKEEQSIRPFFDMDAFKFNLETALSSGYQITGSLVTRPYSQIELLSNPNASTIRNIEQSVFRYIGTIQLSPDNDTWCDTETVDKTIKFGEDFDVTGLPAMKTEWGAWETYGVGYNVYDRRTGDRSGKIDPKKYLGSHTSYASALSSAKKANDGRNLLQTISSEKRVGSVTKISVEEELNELGNFVTDVSLIPYIRPQSIELYVRGVKANTRYYVFFDGELMSNFVTPISIPETGIRQSGSNTPVINDDDAFAGSSVTNSIGTFNIGNEGDPWRADSYGEMLGVLRLPVEGKRFRVGTKEIIVTDSPTNAVDATSYAKSYFVANGLDVKKQNTIISTKIPVIQQEEIVETRQKQKVEVVGPSCMAYSFKVDVPRTEAGIFLTSVDVWVESTDPTLGCWFEIREMNSAGGITRNQVPYSEKWLTVDDFTLASVESKPSNSNYTRVTFDSPVFLQNDNQYAFVIHTEGLNPNYYFWVSRLGENDVNSGEQITTRALKGTLFTTNNNLNYDMVPDVDLTVRFNRADFTVGSGTVVLGNSPIEFINLKDGAGDFIREGETIYTSEGLTLSSNTSGGNTVIVGDIVRTSNVSANVVSIDSPNYFTDRYGFANNESYEIYDSANTSKSITGTLTSVVRGTGKLRYYDSNENLMVLDNTNGKFYANALIVGSLSGNTGRIDTFDQWKYSTTTIKPYYLVFNNTDLRFKKRGLYSNNTFGDWIPGTPDSYSSFDEEKTILSRVNELALPSPSSTAQINAVMSTTSVYVSPVIDLSRGQTIYVHNLINNDATGEDSVSGGNLINRYISKIVTLDDGQDAEDIIVKLTAYRPPNSDVKVWMKLRNDEDGQELSLTNWIEMNYSNSLFSSEADSTNFVEFDYRLPDSYKNSSGVFQYIRNSYQVIANTAGFNNTTNTLKITDANTYFSVGNRVYYSVPPSGTAIAGLTSNTYYFISFANTTDVAVSTTSGGSNVDITDIRTSATGEVHSLGGEVYDTFKQYQIKIGLMGTNSAKPPRVADLRVVALQT